MPLFAFKSNNHFIASSDGVVLQIFELSKSSIDLSSIQKADWKKLATIDTDIEDDDIGSEAPNVMPYNGLLFFEGHGRIEGREALAMVAKHLRQLHLLVNPEGYCFQEVSDFGVYSDVGIDYVRLNDLFSWPRHKIELVSINVWSRLELKYNLPKHNSTLQPPTVGGGVSKEKYAELEKSVKEKDEELEKLKEEMDDAIEANEEELKKLKKASEEQQKQAQKKDKELLRLKNKKEKEEEVKAQRIEELEKLNGDLEEEKAQRMNELEKLNKDLEEANKAKDAKSKNVAELQKQLKKKDDEFRMLKKKKDDEEEANTQRIEELEKQKEEMEDAIEAKNDELLRFNKEKDEEIRKILKRKDAELRALKNKKDDEDEKSKKIEELEKQKEEMELADKTKDEELQKMKERIEELLNEKKKEGEKINEELELELEELREKLSSSVAQVTNVKKELDECQKKKNDEATKTRKMEGELKEAREKLSSSLVQVKKELEHYQKNSWAILPSTKFIPQSLDAKDKYLATRRSVPPGTFEFYSQLSSPYVSNSHKLVGKLRVDHDYTVRLVDEENSPAEWPPLPTLVVCIGRGDEDFDKNNWWYLKTTHPDGGLTMLVFYDGNRSQISLTPYTFEDTIIPLPFSKDLEVYSYAQSFSIFWLYPFGLRFGFAYRPK